MINLEEFKTLGHEMIERIAAYHHNIESFPVKPNCPPNQLLEQLPKHPPESSESLDRILQDFDQLIMPGLTHWQSPKFFAYFPANASFPSILAEFLTAGIAAQCMNWDTSPAAAELEECMMEWLKEMTALPSDWSGVIQDGASTVTLAAMVCARERKTGWESNQHGMTGNRPFRVYCSTEAHSSVEKGAKIAGIGRQNVVKIAVDKNLALIPRALEKAIVEDLQNGLIPTCVVAALGTTGTTAVDPLEPIAAICKKHAIWLHVDAAYAGTALILPEFRWMIKGIEDADSFVFNPHKWMFTHFDCTAYFVRDKPDLLRTFEILPEYLISGDGPTVNNYRDWGIPMGRRFRALKLWFVIRNYGVEGIRRRLREHLELAGWLEETILRDSNFEMMSPRQFNLVCFRLHPPGVDESERLDALNLELEQMINRSGRIFLTHTRVHGAYTLRLVIAQTYVQKRHVEEAWETIKEFSSKVFGQSSSTFESD